jgi:predicted enzyme related to lactoylglutathione lyase
MKSQFLGLRTCIYRVSNIEEAKAWYSKVLATDPYFDESFYVGFNVAGYELGLVPYEDDPKVKSVGVMTYWGVNDVEASYKRLLTLGASPFEEPENVGGEIVVAAVKDPWGNVLGIIYNPEFKLP